MMRPDLMNGGLVPSDSAINMIIRLRESLNGRRTEMEQCFATCLSTPGFAPGGKNDVCTNCLTSLPELADHQTLVRVVIDRGLPSALASLGVRERAPEPLVIDYAAKVLKHESLDALENWLVSSNPSDISPALKINTVKHAFTADVMGNIRSLVESAIGRKRTTGSAQKQWRSCRTRPTLLAALEEVGCPTRTAMQMVDEAITATRELIVRWVEAGVEDRRVVSTRGLLEARDIVLTRFEDVLRAA